MSPTNKDQPFRIISDVDGKLHLHKDNLKKVIEKGISFTKTEFPKLKVETLPVAILSVIGGFLPNECFFFTNALWEYLDDSRKWFSYLTIEEIKYAKHSLLRMKRGQKSKHINSGVFAFSPLVLEIKYDGYEGFALVFLLYCHKCPATKHIDDSTSFERFLSLACSGIMEIFKGGMEQLLLERITKEWNELQLYSEAKPSLKLLPESISPNKVIIHRTQQSQLPNISNIPVATVVSIEDFEFPFLDQEGKLRKYGWLEYHKNSLGGIMKSIGSMRKLNTKRVFQFESDPNNADQFQQSTPRCLQASDMELFFESCVDVANEMKTIIQQLTIFTESQTLTHSSFYPSETRIWNALSSAAFAEMTQQMMSYFLDKWYLPNLVNCFMDTQQEFEAHLKKYFEAKCIPNLVTKYRQHFQYNVLWRYFLYTISDRLNHRFGMMFETLKSVNDKTEETFKKFGYFSKSNFEKIFQQNTESCLKQLKNEDKIIVENIIFAISKMRQSKFKTHNENVASEERRLSQKIIYKIKQFYKKEMSRYLEEYCVLAPEELEILQNRLMDKLMNTFQKCSSFTLFDHLEYKIDRVNENANELKSVLHTLIVSIQQENLRKIQALGERMIKAVFNGKLEYRRQIESILKDYPEGMNENDMLVENQTVSKLVEETLQRRIFEIRKTEPTDLYLLALRKENDFYWTHLLQRNEKKLNTNTTEIAVEAKEDDDEYFSAEEVVVEEGDDALFETAQEYMVDYSFKSQEWFTKLRKNQQELYRICVEVEAQIQVFFNDGDISEMDKDLALETVSGGKEIAMNQSIDRKEVAKAKELVKKLNMKKQ